MTSEKADLAELGSEPERIVYETLIKIGLVSGVDFSWQSAFLGGRMQKGGMVIDFLFTNPPDLAFSVLGQYWHSGRGPEQSGLDLMQRIQLAAQGITLIFLDEADILDDADGVVRAGLNFEDRSRLGKG